MSVETHRVWLPHPGNLNAAKQGVHSPRLIRSRAAEIAEDLTQSFEFSPAERLATKLRVPECETIKQKGSETRPARCGVETAIHSDVSAVRGGLSKGSNRRFCRVRFPADMQDF